MAILVFCTGISALAQPRSVTIDLIGQGCKDPKTMDVVVGGDERRAFPAESASRGHWSGSFPTGFEFAPDRNYASLRLSGARTHCYPGEVQGERLHFVISCESKPARRYVIETKPAIVFSYVRRVLSEGTGDDSVDCNEFRTARGSVEVVDVSSVIETVRLQFGSKPVDPTGPGLYLRGEAFRKLGKRDGPAWVFGTNEVLAALALQRVLREWEDAKPANAPDARKRDEQRLKEAKFERLVVRLVVEEQ